MRLILTLILAALAAGVALADPLRTNLGFGIADFSGFGLGVDLGAGFGAAGPANTSGMTGGGHIGYNLQTGPVVGGVEADMLLGSINGGGLGNASFTQSSLSSARFKAGYAFGNLLAYGTLGWAWSTTHYANPVGSADKLVSGSAFGAGLEYALTRNVTVRGELIRYDFSGASYATPLGAQSLATSTNMFRVGATVHF